MTVTSTVLRRRRRRFAALRSGEPRANDHDLLFMSDSRPRQRAGSLFFTTARTRLACESMPEARTAHSMIGSTRGETSFSAARLDRPSETRCARDDRALRSPASVTSRCVGSAPRNSARPCRGCTARSACNLAPGEFEVVDQRFFLDFADRGRERLFAGLNHSLGKIPMVERAQQQKPPAVRCFSNHHHAGGQSRRARRHARSIAKPR